MLNENSLNVTFVVSYLVMVIFRNFSDFKSVTLQKSAPFMLDLTNVPFSTHAGTGHEPRLSAQCRSRLKMACLLSQAQMAPIFELLFDVFDGLLLQSPKVCLIR